MQSYCKAATLPTPSLKTLGYKQMEYAADSQSLQNSWKTKGIMISELELRKQASMKNYRISNTMYAQAARKCQGLKAHQPRESRVGETP